jgi:hypothetical protein
MELMLARKSASKLDKFRTVKIGPVTCPEDIPR